MQARTCRAIRGGVLLLQLSLHDPRQTTPCLAHQRSTGNYISDKIRVYKVEDHIQYRGTEPVVFKDRYNFLVTCISCRHLRLCTINDLQQLGILALNLIDSSTGAVKKSWTSAQQSTAMLGTESQQCGA